MSGLDDALDRLKGNKKKGEVVNKLADLSDRYRKSKGKGDLALGKNFPKPDVIPTGITELDHHILAVGGIAIGRVVEIAGETNAGKTTLALNICREAINVGKTVVIAENEGTFTYEYAESIGMDPESYHLIKGSNLSGEEYLEEVMRCAELGYDLIVMDSLFGIEPEEASRARLKDMTMHTRQETTKLIAAFARLWKGGWESFTHTGRDKPLIKGVDGGTTLITINHLKSRFGGMGKDTGGSKDIQFLYSQRIWLERRGMSKDDLDENGDPIYTKVNVIGQKSKLSPGGRTVIMYIDNRTGRFYTDKTVVVDLAVRRGVLEKHGSWYHVDEKIFLKDDYDETPLVVLTSDMRWQGAARFAEFLAEHEDLYKFLVRFDSYG